VPKEGFLCAISHELLASSSKSAMTATKSNYVVRFEHSAMQLELCPLHESKQSANIDLGDLSTVETSTKNWV
jgi:hypothetical protein